MRRRDKLQVKAHVKGFRNLVTLDSTPGGSYWQVKNFNRAVVEVAMSLKLDEVLLDHMIENRSW